MAKTDAGARLRNKITLVLAVLILIPSIWGFGTKFVELYHVYSGDVDGAFAVAPIINYLLASAGFFLALLWAISNGMLKDIEAPKHAMLQNEQALDQSQP